MTTTCRPAVLGVLLLFATLPLAAQVRAIPANMGSVSAVPVLAEAAEIQLAREAISPSLSRDADVYVLRNGHFVKAVAGSNGVSCLVARNHEAASRFPMCFDSVGARTLMHREMLRVELLAAGASYESIPGQLDSAYADGRLTRPDKPAMIYMMSRHQDLFSKTRELGPWRPHVMVYLPHTTAAQYKDLPANMGIDPEDKEGVELIVAMPAWSDEDSH